MRKIKPGSRQKCFKSPKARQSHLRRGREERREGESNVGMNGWKEEGSDRQGRMERGTEEWREAWREGWMDQRMDRQSKGRK